MSRWAVRGAAPRLRTLSWSRVSTPIITSMHHAVVAVKCSRPERRYYLTLREFPSKRFAILRCYPSPGLVDQTLRPTMARALATQVLKFVIKATATMTSSKGSARDGTKMCTGVWSATAPTFLSGGVDGKDYKFSIHKSHGFGEDNRRIMIKLPNEGIVFCRGVRGGASNPVMACGLFHPDGRVRDTEGYVGQLGRWNDIVQ